MQELVDIVVDTNILSHANNNNVDMQLSSLAILQWLLENELKLVLDNTGKGAPNPNTSVLYAEYMNTLPPQSPAITLLTHCLSSGRVYFAPRPSKDIQDKIRRLVPKNKKDCAVLGAAFGSSSRQLVSNDLNDFTQSVRKDSKKSLEVDIRTASEFVDLFI